MRKVYVVIGEHLGSDYYTWLSGIYTSHKKAYEKCLFLKKARPENNYRIETEILL